MPITKPFTAIADTAVDPESPLDAVLMTALRDRDQHLYEWIGKDFTPGQNHTHNGVDSARIEVGPNLLRNGGFESDLAGWTATIYTGGAVVASTAGAMEGKKCVAISSTVLANGGGFVLSDEFVPVLGGELKQFVVACKGSIAGIAAKAEAIWYDAAEAQISASQIFASTGLPADKRTCVKRIAAPANARYVRMRLTGGTPGQGTAVGTVYFDGARIDEPAMIGGLRVMTASGTFSDIWGDVEAFVVGAGGGGGAGTITDPGGSGGTGGRAVGPIVLNADETVTVGTGGTANGGTGGTTSVGALISATGGAGGGNSNGVKGADGIGTGGVTGLSGSVGPGFSEGGSGGNGINAATAGQPGIVIFRW